MLQPRIVVALYTPPAQPDVGVEEAANEGAGALAATTGAGAGAFAGALAGALVGAVGANWDTKAWVTPRGMSTELTGTTLICWLGVEERRCGWVTQTT